MQALLWRQLTPGVLRHCRAARTSSFGLDTPVKCGIEQQDESGATKKGTSILIAHGPKRTAEKRLIHWATSSGTPASKGLRFTGVPALGISKIRRVHENNNFAGLVVCLAL